MNKILIDIGNSQDCKIAFASDECIGEVKRIRRDCLPDEVDRIIIEKGNIDKICLTSVRGVDVELEKELASRTRRLVQVSADITLPVEIDYDTPHTLGADRIAAAAGAAELFPGEDCIVFDFGSAITIDFVDASGVFRGGNISPGMNMRFNAMNHFTRKLPLVQGSEPCRMEGKNTVEAINNGTVLGIIFEVQKYIEMNPSRKIIFTGGDAVFFAKMLKSPIFVVCNLVMIGLSEIAQIND